MNVKEKMYDLIVECERRNFRYTIVMYETMYVYIRGKNDDQSYMRVSAREEDPDALYYVRDNGMIRHMELCDIVWEMETR